MDPDPDPAMFVIDQQDAKKNIWIRIRNTGKTKDTDPSLFVNPGS